MSLFSNNNVNSAIVKTINEKIPLVLNELQQLRVYVDSIDQNIKKNRESQIQEKIEEKKEEEEIVNLRQKLMDRDKMILNIWIIIILFLLGFRSNFLGIFLTNPMFFMRCPVIKYLP